MNLVNVLETSSFCESNSIKHLFSYIGQMYSIIKIIIPILIIIFGTIDLFKGIIANNEESKKLQKRFVKRMIFGIAVFFIFPIVSFLINMIGSNIDNECMICFTYYNDSSKCSYINRYQEKIKVDNSNKNFKCSDASDKDLCCKETFGINDSNNIWIWNDDIGCKNTTPASPN